MRIASQKISDLATYFLGDDNKSQFGRVVGLATHTDGSLLITDDSNGVVYRVAHSAGNQQRNKR